ncbi:PE-PGRS family protein [Mycolicibacterium rhodesiae JS60]|nr:PE-PGRS family protein [Mycolicibacterium rhodesiae JS60]
MYTADGQTLLYTDTTDVTNTPTVTSDYLLNTGYEALVQQPAYIGYSPTGFGTTIFDYP